MEYVAVFAEGALVAALVSYLFSKLIVATQNWHGGFSLDNEMSGKQKFHTVPVPRVGGLALMLGMMCGLAWVRLMHANAVPQGVLKGSFWLVVAAQPVFIIGLVEDMTKKVSVRLRLICTLAGTLIAVWLLGALVPRIDVWLVDDALRYAPVSVAITVFAVVGVSNAVNIIDGFNGIAGSTVAVMLAGMAFVAWQAHDALLMNLSLLGIGAAAGFLLVNYPRGKLFMGDGGACLLGFWCAEIAVLAIKRNPQVDAWQVLAIYAYPVIEVLYSMYRKKLVRKMSPAIPDRLHLHMLIYRRLVCQLLPRGAGAPWMRNAAVILVISPLTILFTVAAVAVSWTGVPAIFLFAIEVSVYVVLYTRLVRGRWFFHPKFILGLTPTARRNPA